MTPWRDCPFPRALLTMLLLSFLTPAAVAQTSPEAPSAAADPHETLRHAAPPDLEIFARVAAREVTHRTAPRGIDVRFTGDASGVWESDSNLPDVVKEGVTYRSLGLTLTISAFLPDPERFVSLLGLEDEGSEQEDITPPSLVAGNPQED